MKPTQRKIIIEINLDKSYFDEPFNFIKDDLLQGIHCCSLNYTDDIQIREIKTVAMDKKEVISQLCSVMRSITGKPVDERTEKERNAYETAIAALNSFRSTGMWEAMCPVRTFMAPYRGIRYRCSICHNAIDITLDKPTPNFCENCGSIMVGRK